MQANPDQTLSQKLNEASDSEEIDDFDYEMLSSSPSIHEDVIDPNYVYALHSFSATAEGQASATKGDAMVLLNDSHSYWWLVLHAKNRSIGYLPAEHIETPSERLARLNKHRNGDVDDLEIEDDFPYKGRSDKFLGAPLPSASKNVTFSDPSAYIEHEYEAEYSTDDYADDEIDSHSDIDEEWTEETDAGILSDHNLSSPTRAFTSSAADPTTQNPVKSLLPSTNKFPQSDLNTPLTGMPQSAMLEKETIGLGLIPKTRSAVSSLASVSNGERDSNRRSRDDYSINSESSERSTTYSPKSSRFGKLGALFKRTNSGSRNSSKSSADIQQSILSESENLVTHAQQADIQSPESKHESPALISAPDLPGIDRIGSLSFTEQPSLPVKRTSVLSNSSSSNGLESRLSSQRASLRDPTIDLRSSLTGIYDSYLSDVDFRKSDSTVNDVTLEPKPYKARRAIPTPIQEPRRQTPVGQEDISIAETMTSAPTPSSSSSLPRTSPDADVMYIDHITPSPVKMLLQDANDLIASRVQQHCTSVSSSRMAKEEKKAPQVQQEELSEEDLKLKNELELLVERIQEPNASLHSPAMNQLKTFIRTSTSSMTAVPKPLKFLMPHYDSLVEVYNFWSDAKLKSQLADILSVLAMTSAPAEQRSTLKYRLAATDIDDDPSLWGHEYMRHLALEIGEQFSFADLKGEATSDLVDLALKISPFFLKHNAEADAIDLLAEVDAISELPALVDESVYSRVCLYMISCVNFLAPPDDSVFLRTAFDIYMKFSSYPQALVTAMRLHDEARMESVFHATEDLVTKKQLALILSRQNIYLESITESQDETDYVVVECMDNSRLSEFFLYLSKELLVTDPMVPEDIFKSHLDHSVSRPISSSLDSAKQNLGAAYVNAFANTGFGNDKLITVDDESSSWIYKTKDAGMLATTASCGLIFLWDINAGLEYVFKFLDSSEPMVKAGALLGIGILHKGVRSEADAPLALLSEPEYLESPNSHIRSSAIMGLGLANAGSARAAVASVLLPIVQDPNVSVEHAGLAALALGQVFVGTCNGEVSEAILSVLMERSAHDLSDKWARFLALGLALLYTNRAEEIDAVVEAVKVIEHKLSAVTESLIVIASHAGSGDVLTIQLMLHDCLSRADSDEEEEEDEDEEDEAMEDEEAIAATTTGGETEASTSSERVTLPAASAFNLNSDSPKDSSGNTDGATTENPSDETSNNNKQIEKEKISARKSYSVLGIAAVAMGEEIGQEMSLRHFSHLMHYGDDSTRRAVPLALGLLYSSNPEMKVFETLSRYSHDSDLDVAMNAIFAMGIVGAGTKNARLALLLRQLATYYSREPSTLFMVRIAQGLLYLGKGTQTLNPLHTDRQVMSQTAFAGLLSVLVMLLDAKQFMSTHHYLLYNLVLAIQPRMLITVDENLEPLTVNVRVGQAVDVVGQAGRPKSITGWVTNTTPVLLGYGERAELEDDKYISQSAALEGIVILKKNPEYMEVDDA
ncbi:hypothetical protein CANCADRAFT_68858 [Tortispora caseinolytica NRRL Y-17796]|uniref:SH3 domain-containing protein n=1 Tax=Tortispora caseinolytica NRRL Y-17796 TaxID=767744 RepID=A0A1E4TGH4_9ASCO|nr:hypothetical protein CANCADRAFT_68858 [Tortispora caseinolytica NRRL Y-17796]